MTDLTARRLIGEAAISWHPHYAVHATTPWNYSLPPAPQDQLAFSSGSGPLTGDSFPHGGTKCASPRPRAAWTSGSPTTGTQWRRCSPAPHEARNPCSRSPLSPWKRPRFG
jgi:hypothetical protein